MAARRAFSEAGMSAMSRCRSTSDSLAIAFSVSSSSSSPAPSESPVSSAACATGRSSFGGRPIGRSEVRNHASNTWS